MTACACCGRILTKPPTMVLGMALGPECANRFAGLEGYLASHGITFPTEFPMVPNATFDGFRAAPELLEIERLASSLGVKLATTDTWGKTPITHVTGVRRADPARINAPIALETRLEIA